jgi:hypothetical protein
MLALLVLWGGVWTGLAVDEVPYAVSKEPWADGLGNHRAVVRVEKKADAVLVRIPWRRRDHDPERKEIIVMDAASNQRVTNVARLRLDRFEGVLAFQSRTVPGEYFVYYLPYTPQPGYGNYNGDYLPPKETAASDWKARLPENTVSMPRASVLRLEARTAFDSFYPMEVVATPEETQRLLGRSAAVPSRSSKLTPKTVVEPPSHAPSSAAAAGDSAPSYLLFPEDRRFPVRMTDELPLRWIKAGPAEEFGGDAQRNEFYVFQIGVWATRTNLQGIKVEFDGKIAQWLTCFNTGGTNWDGQPFRKVVNVPQGKIQALWFGVDVPRDAKPGLRSARVTIRPTNAPPVSVELKLKVLPAELADRGDGDPWRLSRLRWLNSTLGSDDTVVAPFTPLEWLDRATIRYLGRDMSFDQFAAPRQITSAGQALLATPVSFEIQDEQGAVLENHPIEGPWEAKNTPGAMALGARWVVPQFYLNSLSTVEADGNVACKLTVEQVPPPPAEAKAFKDRAVCQLKLKIPLRPEVATYFMGLGLPACRTPTNYTWHWTGPYNSFWVGNAQAGLHVRLLGSSYEGPMQNLYHPAPPPSWFNAGKGGVTITNGPNGEVLAEIFTGPFELKAGEKRVFDFSLLVTPVKPLDTAAHFRERYWHSTHDVPEDVNIINVHHATTPNPFINYPLLEVDKLRAFCQPQQAQGRKVKIYYTVRELTTHLPELWALRSLGDEVLAGGPGGGFPWLREHLASGYTTAWYNIAEGGMADAAILTSGASRWYNFYVEGINWLARNVPIDGLYLDDVAYDRTILKRVRKVLDRARPGCLIDLHSNTLFSKGPANQYTEFFPYVNRLWFGEGFNYDAMSPEQWLVETSGIPFGLMGDMLQDGGNRWRGMVFGMTARLPWTKADPRPVWKVWDDFGIADARMWGWWEKDCPVRTGRADVLATAYVKPGKTLVALASWAPDKTEVRLQINWPALGLDASKARLIAPEIKDFQPAKEWRADDPITVEPKRGWLILVKE